MTEHTRTHTIVIISLIVALAIALGVVVFLATQNSEKSSSTITNSTQDTSTSRHPEYDKDIDIDSAISAEKAGKIVIDEYGGSVKSVENDHYGGQSVWEVEAYDTSSGRIEVKVDKKTGEILSKEQD